jgi:hypothetical protein
MTSVVKAITGSKPKPAPAPKPEPKPEPIKIAGRDRAAEERAASRRARRRSGGLLTKSSVSPVADTTDSLGYDDTLA